MKTYRVNPLLLSLALILSNLALASPALAGDEPSPDSDTEVQYLLEFVAASGCSFIRNGSVHDPADAADHLRLKYRKGKKYVDSAGQFIDRLASESSWTGKAYTVDCNGTVEPSKAWLHRALDDYRQREAVAAPQAAPHSAASPTTAVPG